MNKYTKDILLIALLCIPLTGIVLFIEENRYKEISLPIEQVYREKILVDIPEDSKYNGYRVDYINNKTILSYEYNKENHTVHIFHPENKKTREVYWNEVINIKYY